MIKRTLLLSTITLLLAACDSTSALRTVEDILGTELTRDEVAAGLKQALEIGITKGADQLSQPGGYFNSVYRIELPPQARQVTEKLRIIPGFGDLEEVIVEKINRGAEDAAKKAAPIFIDAIKQMTFQDAWDILMGSDNAATRYLHLATHDRLYGEFKPVIASSLDKFEAQKIWRDAVTAYNRLPLVEPANPDLGDYVTTEALQGLFDKVEEEEKNIRDNISARTTDLLRRVFARQDNRGWVE